MLFADDFVSVSDSREGPVIVCRYCNRWRLKANVHCR